VFKGTEVAFDEQHFLDVTQMWRAAGSPPGKEFETWRRSAGASFIADLAKALKVGQACLTRTVLGPSPEGGSWAHWQIALAYASDLSPEFHIFINEAFREWAQEAADPGLKVERGIEGYRRRGKDYDWISNRLKEILKPHGLIDELAEHGVTCGGAALCSDAIKVGVAVRTEPIRPPGRTAGALFPLAPASSAPPGDRRGRPSSADSASWHAPRRSDSAAIGRPCSASRRTASARRVGPD
jgi:hypothetical protein